MKINSQKIKSALFMFLCTFITLVVLHNLIFSPIWIKLVTTNGSSITKTIIVSFNYIKYFLIYIVAVLIYSKLIAKCNSSIILCLVFSIAYSLLTYTVIRYTPVMIGTSVGLYMYSISAITSIIFSFAYVFLTKSFLPDGNTGNNNVAANSTAPTSSTISTSNANYEVPTFTAPARTSAPVDMDALSVAILNAVRPSLKAPLTAVLCSHEEMTISNTNGEYEIQGYVNSQNSYGAMIATDFTAKARYVNGNWIITNSAIGVKNAKNYAKSFAANYIVISIFVGVMGLLGYLILKMIFGF